MTARDEQKEQRRQLIIDKAIELFAKKGYAETKIGDIAAAADMSVGLMFHYFESKEKLLEEIVRYGAKCTDYPKEMNFENPLDYFEGFLKMLFHYAIEQPRVMYLFVIMGQLGYSESIPKSIRDIFSDINQVEQSAEIIAAGQQYGYFREGDPHSLAFAFWSSVQGIMEQLAAFPEMRSEEKIPDYRWIIDILRGKNHDKSRKYP
ncbi:MAG: TetR/AcrR family transcriptional regulator [Ruminococcaceae bacterium]|nr:TetR/AcrR family transcriptional regulator [Oscillospiraceae bacterium]